MNISKFQNTIRLYYKKNKRDLPWRKTRDPYKILVSEVMLQQTQVSRVESRYKSFLKKFPTVEALAQATTEDVLREWQGLGYNRRALFLKRCAEKIDSEFKGKFPKDFKTLTSLPGIGPATAGDIMAFAWNMAVVVIETNIRSVFIHFFFQSNKDEKKVHDKEILPLIEKTLDRKNPREWYYALFDYGVYLKKTFNPSRQSIHHVRQSPFEGSYRQKRAETLRLILYKPETKSRLQKTLNYQTEILDKILSDLESEGFIRKTKNGLYNIV